MSRSHRDISSLELLSEHNPIAFIEEYMLTQDLECERTDEFDLWVDIKDQWGDQKLWVVYHDDSEFLQFNCYLNLKIPKRCIASVAETMLHMNEQLWLGHFEIWWEERVPLFRVVHALRGSEFSPEQLEDILVSIAQETNRFYPALQWVIWGGRQPKEAVRAALFETEGEA
ncbi:YbjN domain-containing protein [Magnetococcales bacterium HHB-1]